MFLKFKSILIFHFFITIDSSILFNQNKTITLLNTTSISKQLIMPVFPQFRPKRRRHKRNAAEDVFDPTRSSSLICNLCLVVDEKFAQSHELLNEKAIVTSMNKLVDKVSWIFRNIDWNDDGFSDNIGFEITSLVYGWNPYPYEMLEEYERPKPSMELLGKFAEQDFRSCCVGVGFTNRPFEKNQVGVSFIASKTLMGGICDHRNPSAPLQSANVALISARGLNQSKLSMNDLETIFLHELGHTFGVLKHDQDETESKECSGFLKEDYLPEDYMSPNIEPPKGRFIMWGQELQGAKELKVNNLKFSPCSRAAVMEVFNSGQGRGSCLTLNETVFCGNGIVEFPEECDCGNEVSCKNDRCCGPRGSSTPCQIFKGIKPEDCPLLSKPTTTAHPNSGSFFNQSSIVFLFCLIYEIFNWYKY